MIIPLPSDRVPEVADDAFVAPNATLIGRVRLGERVSVWYGVVLRGDLDIIDIGAGSNIQDNAVFHTDPGLPLVLGQRVTVGHGAVVHGATIQDDVLVGMGSIILNGCQIGTGSIIGAGTVLSENSVIPPGSLVLGVPGKVRRETTSEERELIVAGALDYERLAATHRSAMN